jgi:HKD family nuclease
MSARTVSAHVQIVGSRSYLFDRLNALLSVPNLQRFRAAVSYARWDGLGLIAPKLETLLKAGGDFQSIYGIANGITTPDSLLYSLYLRELYKTHSYAGSVEDKYANATFHPKFFEFQFAETTVAFIGSANLTGGGLIRNSELDVEIKVSRESPFAKELDEAWRKLRDGALPVTLARIRSMVAKDVLGSELRTENVDPSQPPKPMLKTGVKASPKPLFRQVLKVSSPRKRNKILSDLDTITEKPERLYLQVLEYETGGQAAGGKPGYQIQLPVATLAAFFGVGPTQPQKVTFFFGVQPTKVSLTHFGNKTHRVRLKPLQNIKRPAIVIFERFSPNRYHCSVVPPGSYNKILQTNCTEQTRTGARKWGLG